MEVERFEGSDKSRAGAGDDDEAAPAPSRLFVPVVVGAATLIGWGTSTMLTFPVPKSSFTSPSRSAMERSWELLFAEVDLDLLCMSMAAKELGVREEKLSSPCEEEEEESKEEGNLRMLASEGEEEEEERE